MCDRGDFNIMYMSNQYICVLLRRFYWKWKMECRVGGFAQTDWVGNPSDFRAILNQAIKSRVPRVACTHETCVFSLPKAQVCGVPPTCGTRQESARDDLLMLRSMISIDRPRSRGWVRAVDCAIAVALCARHYFSSGEDGFCITSLMNCLPNSVICKRRSSMSAPIFFANLAVNCCAVLDVGVNSIDIFGCATSTRSTGARIPMASNRAAFSSLAVANDPSLTARPNGNGKTRLSFDSFSRKTASA